VENNSIDLPGSGAFRPTLKVFAVLAGAAPGFNGDPAQFFVTREVAFSSKIGVAAPCGRVYVC
jgi:hypothetical protein